MGGEEGGGNLKKETLKKVTYPHIFIYQKFFEDTRKDIFYNAVQNKILCLGLVC